MKSPNFCVKTQNLKRFDANFHIYLCFICTECLALICNALLTFLREISVQNLPENAKLDNLLIGLLI